MNWVDGIIIAGAGLALWTGYRRGALLQVFSWGGFVFGFIAGVALAPKVIGLFHISKTNNYTAIYTIVALLGIAFVVEGLVAALGMRLRKKITNTTIHKTDKIIGSVVAAVLSLVGSWLLGVTFRHGPSPAVASAIKHSAVLRAIDAVAPPPPSVLAQVWHLLGKTGFPEVFTGLNPALAPGVDPPPASLANDKKILSAAEITYKIESKGCGGIVDGSGFPIGNNMVVTAAHVVAGTHDTLIIPARSSTTYKGTVVYLDSNHDIAIISVSLPPPVFTVISSADKPGSDGAAIGYPHGGPRKISPARVRARTEAVGYDIYSKKRVTREIYVLRARVVPGNSGGPFVDTDGNVRGMVFAAAQDNPDESYALAETEIFKAASNAKGKSAVVDRGECAL